MGTWDLFNDAKATKQYRKQQMNTRTFRSITLMVGLLALAPQAMQAQSNWVRKANMPTARFWFTACAVEGKIHAIGGTRSISAPYLPTVEEYDPATDTWTRRANMPTARDGHVATVVDGKIYVIGGEPSAQASIPTVEAYDPVTDAWTQKANMPTRRTFACAGAVSGKIYVISGVKAGKSTNPQWDTHADPLEETRAVEEYDLVTDTWTRKADIPTQRDGAAAAVVNGKLYVMGGATGDLHSPPVKTVEEYDPSTDTWTRKAPMPTARIFPSATVMGGKIYVVGGAIWPNTFFSTVEMFDPVTDTWTAQPPLAAKRYGLCSDAVNGKIYAIGGCQVGYPGAGLATVEEYDPTPTVSASRSGSTLRISWNGILEASENVDGTNWQALNPATWPFSINVQAAPMKFYRARQP